MKRIKSSSAGNFILDIKCMNEIVNIHSQLIDMLRERNYQVNNKYNYNEVVKCVCSGLKQYICNKVKKGRVTYNSPTEREIRIHPGSFLFGENPNWIVGGEIVNTGRTYIRSAAVVPDEIIKSDFSDVYRAVSKKDYLKKEVLRFEETRIKTREIREDNKIYIHG